MEPKKHAIVTGAASGLGRATAVELARHGWHVAVADVNDAGSQETLTLLRAAGGQGQVEHLDVTRPEEWQALRDRLQNAWPNLDLLVNNAGVGVGGEVGTLPLDDWHWIVNINLYGAIYGCHMLVAWMKGNPRGAHIVNIASMAAVASAPGMAPYNVTKAGMLSLSETLYGELKPHNIGVTAVCPSFFQTNILRSGRFQDEGQKNMAAKLMSRSSATADDVAHRILRAIERRQLYVMVPGIATFYWRLKRLAPRFVLNLIAHRYAKETAAPRKPEEIRSH
jgi:NAD(P)-dependent dehydrogenase (short-subunit alcohol dehydrogenase family)